MQVLNCRIAWLALHAVVCSKADPNFDTCQHSRVRLHCLRVMALQLQVLHAWQACEANSGEF